MQYPEGGGQSHSFLVTANTIPWRQRCTAAVENAASVLSYLQESPLLGWGGPAFAFWLESAALLQHRARLVSPAAKIISAPSWCLCLRKHSVLQLGLLQLGLPQLSPMLLLVVALPSFCDMLRLDPTEADTFMVSQPVRLMEGLPG